MEDPANVSSIGSLVWSNKGKLLASVVLGGVVGGGTGLALPHQYSAEARLAVGGTSLSAYSVAGFAEASQELASNYARYIDNLAVAGGGATVVRASPIPESNVIRIEAVGPSTEEAVAAARETSLELINQVNGRASEVDNQNAADALSQFNSISQELSVAEQRKNWLNTQLENVTEDTDPATVPALAADAAAATTTVSDLQVRLQAQSDRYKSAIVAGDQNQSVEVSVIADSRSTGSNAAALAQRLAILAAAASGLLALVALHLIGRRRRQRAARGSSPKEIDLRAAPEPGKAEALAERAHPSDAVSPIRAGGSRPRH